MPTTSSARGMVSEGFQELALALGGVAASYDLPDEAIIGIRRFGGCGISRLIAPVGPIQRQLLKSEILGIEPAGATPIDSALRETQNDLTNISDPQLILLISDGMETCGGDPVAAAQELISLGYELRIHVVGFDVSRNVAARDQLIEIAQATGGVYYDAENSAQLREALSLAAPFSYTVYDTEGDVVYAGRLGEAGPQLPAGSYTIVIDTNPPITLSNVQVEEQQTTMITVEKANGGYQADVGN